MVAEHGGNFTESLGSAISGTFGGLPTVTYNQNIGALMVTGVGSRFVYATTGVILVILGVAPRWARSSPPFRARSLADCCW